MGRWPCEYVRGRRPAGPCHDCFEMGTGRLWLRCALRGCVTGAVAALAATGVAGAAAPSIPLEQWKVENSPSVLAPADEASVLDDSAEFSWVTLPGTRDKLVVMSEDAGEVLVSADPFQSWTISPFSSASIDAATGVARAAVPYLAGGRYFWHIARSAIGAENTYQVDSLDRLLVVLEEPLESVEVATASRRGSSSRNPGHTVLRIEAARYTAGTLTLRRNGRASKRALSRRESRVRTVAVMWSCTEPGGSYSYTVSMRDDSGVTKHARGRFRNVSRARCRSIRAAERRARSLPQKLTLALAETRTIRVIREQLGAGAEYEARVGCTRLTRYAARCRFTSFAGDISWRGHVRIVNRAGRWDWTLTGVRTDEYHGDSEALNASGSH